MRTLVLQLARFGDVYQTWPTLNALVRRGDEVHVLVRERFRGALAGLGGVTVHALDTADVLTPIVTDGDDAASLARLTASLDGLKARGFTRVINLSFSPLSSFITDYLSGEGVEVRGYTRHADGFFTVADDFSAYFYAQVGVGRTNRYHLIDLFAGVAGVELCDADGQAVITPPPPSRTGVVVHLGASQADKAYPPELWAAALADFKDESLTLIGSADERALADAVITRAGLTNAQNLAGQTAVADLLRIIAGARLLVGADSAPVHVAALTGTPVLNLSCDAVNFWETGPVSAGSRVLREAAVDRIAPDRIAAEVRAMLAGQAPTGPCFVRATRADTFTPHECATDDDFAWALTEALYTGSTYPASTASADLAAFRRVFEVAELALAALDAWDGPRRAQSAEQLSLVDELLREIPRLSPRVAPLTQWFETERLRLGPGAEADVLVRTRKIFADLKVISSVYVREAPLDEALTRVSDLGRAIAPALREYDFARVEGEFNELLTVLHDLARRSTKVEGWSGRVNGLAECLARRDYIELADRIEFDLPRDLKTSGADVLV